MPPDARTLAVTCRSGLANRLRVLLSGTILARATGRTFHMTWTADQACAATFDRLFAGDWHVDATAPAQPFVGFDTLGSPPPDLLASPASHLALQHVGSFFAPWCYPSHAALEAEAAALAAQLTPSARLEQRIERFTADHFLPAMIGVHLRRGDFHRRMPDVVDNTAAALAAVDTALEQDPTAGVFLSTDDGGPDQMTGRVRREGVRESFRTRYGSRVVWVEPRSLDRRDPTAIEDAVVDLWLLRRATRLIGTTASSFSAFAALGRDVPLVLCGTPTPRYVRLARLARLTGFEAALRALPLSARLGPDPSLAALWSFYASLPGAARRRIRRAIARGTRGGQARDGS